MPDNVFTAPGLRDPGDADAGYLPDDPDCNREREELFNKWETVGLTEAEKARFAELTRERRPSAS